MNFSYQGSTLDYWGRHSTYDHGSVYHEEAPPTSQVESPSTSPWWSLDEDDDLKGCVEKSGYISVRLRHGIHLSITSNQGVEVVNTKQNVSLALSSCGTQMAMVHPYGRILQYNTRIEIETVNEVSVKNAKIWPRGVSFTADNCSMIYLLDAAGARTTTDTFHDLHSTDITNGVLTRSWYASFQSKPDVVNDCLVALNKSRHWVDDEGNDFLKINGVLIKQTRDGYVSVERKNGLEVFDLRTSPNNGTVRFQSSFLYVTGSMGKEAHVFVKSKERRIHYNGASFVVRNGGHSAGFNEFGVLKIW
ncbi:hypothetical protein TCAL_04192 [Tigriopus californicus]|uniref:Uncharacterized protein n=1 Tax=Tigriopus californicus TaxID=6832 RepID=A0A553N823_TIGCA|nr:uncharacterized protein LOC131884475 [Tigriopus californicus]TRY61560.1 hypothetical protein TCAL_04192 [Tigriopus californicus]